MISQFTVFHVPQLQVQIPGNNGGGDNIAPTPAIAHDASADTAPQTPARIISESHTKHRPLFATLREYHCLAPNTPLRAGAGEEEAMRAFVPREINLELEVRRSKLYILEDFWSEGSFMRATGLALGCGRNI